MRDTDIRLLFWTRPRPLPVLLQLCNERASLPSSFLRADSSGFAVADLAYRPLELTPAALALKRVLGNDPSSPIILNHSQTLIRDFVIVRIVAIMRLTRVPGVRED